MMRIRQFTLSLLSVAFLFCIFLLFATVGCSNIFPDEPEAEEETEQFHSIQYSDDNGVYTITVQEGEGYSLAEIPTRIGYEFVGLFDSETEGVQYVSEKGESISPYYEKKDIVLFSRFKPIEYTVILDFQGGQSSFESEFTVLYGEALSALPQDVVLANCFFAGWYTQKNCNGNRVTDFYGLIPDTSVVNEINFDLSSNKIYLYAGFMNSVTFHFDEMTEEVYVPYQTDIKDVKLKTSFHSVAPFSWSKKQEGSEIFEGEIKENLVLYAVEYAPFITFDSNGGSPLQYIVAKADSYVSLPRAQRDGYFFAGWYDDNGEKVASSFVMPSNSVELRAGWYAENKELISIYSDKKFDSDKSESYAIDPIMVYSEYIDLYAYLPENCSEIRVSFDWYMRHGTGSSTGEIVERWKGGITASAQEDSFIYPWLIETFDVVSSESQEYITQEQTIFITQKGVYLRYYANRTFAWTNPIRPMYIRTYLYFTNIVMQLSYPDTSVVLL